MQIFKRLNNIKPAQNVIEFVFILPILIFVTLVIFEVGLFWQDVNAIYNLNAEINANLALINPGGLNIGDTCPAATRALNILEQRDSMISLSNQTYDTNIINGKEPFALYEFTAGSVKNQTKPQIALWVDCRDPFEDGYTSQLEFYHKTLIIKATIPRFEKPEGIVIIPENIFIASPKLNTLRQY